MQLFRKVLVLASLLAGVGNAQAVLLQIEMTGELEYGFQSGIDTFGILGGAGYYTELTGREAVFNFTIDTDATHINDTWNNYNYYDSGSFYGLTRGLVTNTVTINNVTRSVAGDYLSNITIAEDQDGSGVGSRDELQVVAADFSYFGNGNVNRNNYMGFSAYDPVNSILEGVGLNQLDGWSVTNPFEGNAIFHFMTLDINGDLTEWAYGQIALNQVRIWGAGLNDEPSPVSEPSSLALLGVGLGLLAVRRRARR